MLHLLLDSAADQSVIESNPLLYYTAYRMGNPGGTHPSDRYRHPEPESIPRRKQYK